MIFVAIAIVGVYSYINLPIDFYPEMEIPAVSVITAYPGANAADVEINVTKVIEDALSSVPDLKEISSTSQDNMSVVSIEYEWETDLSNATNDVRDYLDRVSDDLPEDSDKPLIVKFNTSMMPILMYVITADESYMGLEKMIDERVINPLNRINGIGSISMVGGPKRVVYVESDPQKLESYNLTIEQIGSAIQMENLNLPAGSVKMGREDYQMRIEGEFTESSQLRDVVVGNHNGRVVFLKDVASVRDTIKDLTLDQRLNGSQAMGFFVTKQSGANTVEIANQVKKQLAEIQKDLPKDIVFNEVMDTSDYIQKSIDGLSESLMYAFLFVILVILFFLGRWRATFIIVLTIPVSLIAAFIYLYFTGSSLNVISLSSLTIAIGMVVDDAIVVLENITNHIERGSSPREAAVYATNEVWLSVIVTTLVILAVFLPLTMVGGQMGVMFKELGFIVSITVIISTIAAISLTPMLSSRLLRLREKDLDKSKKGWYEKYIITLLDKVDAFYEKVLRWCLLHKKTVIATAIGIFAASLFLLQFIGFGFMPESDQGSVSATVELQRGTRTEVANEVAARLEERVSSQFPEELKFISSTTGSDDQGGVGSLFNERSTNIINFTFRLVDKEFREKSSFEIAEEIRGIIAEEVEVITYSVSTANNMGAGENKVDIEIFGHDFDATNSLAQEIKKKVSTINGARDITIDRKEDKAELQIVFDREKLAKLGLNSATVSSYVRNRVTGLTAGQFREDGDEYDIIVRFADGYRNSINDIENITFTTPKGVQVKLKEVGAVKEFWSPPNIAHKRKERIVTVSVTPVGVALGTMAEEINAQLKTLDIPQDIIINVGGSYEDQQESTQDLMMLMAMALILVYIVMASQFESFAKPFVIMLSALFGFSGVFLALFITGTEMNMIAMLGAILLIGIVVKNGIVLVDFINLMRDRDMELNEAIAISGKSRLRPVLMTAATTILGMLPMAISTSDGSEIWQPLGIAVIGGLTVSTIVTLVIVPVMYAVMARSGERDKEAKLRKQFAALND